MRALIAEDDSISRRMLEAFLVKWGYEVRVAAEGEEAWAILHDKDSPRLAILDWMMPQMTGIELLRKVRASEEYAATPFLMVTAEAQQENVIEAVQAKVSNYIVKPFTAETLKQKIDKIFDS